SPPRSAPSGPRSRRGRRAGSATPGSRRARSRDARPSSPRLEPAASAAPSSPILRLRLRHPPRPRGDLPPREREVVLEDPVELLRDPLVAHAQPELVDLRERAPVEVLAPDVDLLAVDDPVLRVE